MERMDQFLAKNPNPVLSMRNNGIVLYSNVAGEPLLNAWGVRIGERLPSCIGDFIQRVVLQNSPESMEVRVGNRVYLISFHPFPEEECVNIYGFDISDQKKLEERLLKSEARLRQFYESDIIGVFYYNLDGSITEANDKLLEIVGYTHEDLQAGRVKWNKMTPSEYRQLDDHAIMELKVKGVNTPYEKECIRKDGSRVSIIVGVATFDQTRNEGIAFVLDITERKEAEKALEKIENFRKKEIHHRIKNNLQVISSLLGLQVEKFNNRECIKDSEVLKAFKESQDRVMSIALIHEELHEGGGNDAVNFSLYLEKLAENLFQTYKLGNTDVNLNINLEENLFFDMDIAVPLGMVVNELITNSLKYAFPDRETGEVQIKLFGNRLSEDKEELAGKIAGYTLIVSDNGVGIPQKIDFENPDTLGLQLVNILVDQLDGEIEIKRDKGAEFEIRFTVTEKMISR